MQEENRPNPTSQLKLSSYPIHLASFTCSLASAHPKLSGAARARKRSKLVLRRMPPSTLDAPLITVVRGDEVPLKIAVVVGSAAWTWHHHAVEREALEVVPETATDAGDV